MACSGHALSALWKAIAVSTAAVRHAGSVQIPTAGPSAAFALPHRPIFKGNKILCILKSRVKLKLTDSSASNGKLQARWHNCSVVSSSGVLGMHQLGPDIDKADLIIRFNDAPTAGYEKNVGRREGMRFINGAFATNMTLHGSQRETNASNGISYAVVPMSAAPTMAGLKRRFPGVEWFMLDGGMSKSFQKVLEEVYWSDRWAFHGDPRHGNPTATSGAIGMLSALAVCDEVRGYGMASSRTMYGAPYHYYDRRSGKAWKNYWHKGFSIEKDLWRRLATNPSDDIDKTDVVVIPGFARAKCP